MPVTTCGLDQPVALGRGEEISVTLVDDRNGNTVWE
jgi:hypothetical protein